MKLLVDSDYLVGAFRIDDSHYVVAKDVLGKASAKGHALYVLSLVLQETATVLSHRTGMNAVVLFRERYEDLHMHIIRLDEALEGWSWQIFLNQKKKGTSFVDCANLATIQTYKLNGILSFDHFYPSSLRITSVKQ